MKFEVVAKLMDCSSGRWPLVGWSREDAIHEVLKKAERKHLKAILQASLSQQPSYLGPLYNIGLYAVEYFAKHDQDILVQWVTVLVEEAECQWQTEFPLWNMENPRNQKQQQNIESVLQELRRFLRWGEEEDRMGWAAGCVINRLGSVGYGRNLQMTTLLCLLADIPIVKRAVGEITCCSCGRQTTIQMRGGYWTQSDLGIWYCGSCDDGVVRITLGDIGEPYWVRKNKWGVRVDDR